MGYSIKISLLSGSGAQVVNALFPIVTTPLVAYVAGGGAFSNIALVAMLAYIQSAVVDAGISTYAIGRWGHHRTSSAFLSRAYAHIAFAQIAMGVVSGAIMLTVCLIWLEIPQRLAIIGVIAGFAPVLYPAWMLMITGQGLFCLYAVTVSRIASLACICAIHAFSDNHARPELIALAWILVPSVVPGIIIFPKLPIRLSGRRTSYSFYRAISGQLFAGVGIKLSIAVYGSIPALLLGRFAAANVTASYMLLDRMRVIGQTVVSTQYPSALIFYKSRLKIKNDNLFLSLASATISILYLVAYVIVFPFASHLFSAKRGWVFDEGIVTLMAVLGALVVFSNTMIYMKFVPRFGQKLLLRLLAPSAIFAVCIIPLAYYYFGVDGALKGAISVELLISVLVVRKLFRSER